MVNIRLTAWKFAHDSACNVREVNPIWLLRNRCYFGMVLWIFYEFVGGGEFGAGAPDKIRALRSPNCLLAQGKLQVALLEFPGASLEMNFRAENDEVVTAISPQRPVYPPGWFFHCWVVFAALLTLWGSTPPGGYGGQIIVGTFLCAITALVWLARASNFFSVPNRFRVQSQSTLKRYMAWGTAPLLLGFTFQAIDSNVPFRVAFYFSRPALDRLAHASMEDRSVAFAYPRIGWYATRQIQSTSDGMMLYTKSGFWFAYGFAYSPHRKPTIEPVNPEERLVFRPIKDGWYYFQG